MPMPLLARSLMAGAMLALTLGTVGCTADYWSQILSFSTVRADVAAAGKVEWAVTRDEVSGMVTGAVPTYTVPEIKLSLDANSAPVNYTTAQADYFYTEGATNDAGKLAPNPVADISTQYFPFAAQLKTESRATAPEAVTVKLNGVIPQRLIEITDPREDSAQILTAVVATVKLTGTNGFGARITTTVSVPINISYN